MPHVGADMEVSEQSNRGMGRGSNGMSYCGRGNWEVVQ